MVRKALKSVCCEAQSERGRAANESTVGAVMAA